MQSKKVQKIDLNADYPCPCRRRGHLVPIALTEAFGCDRCQQIFVVDQNRQAIEQLATHYPYKRSWRWTGQQWMMAHSGLGSSYLPIALCIIAVLAIVWLPLALHLPLGQNVVPWVVMALMLAISPALIIWLAHRR